MRSFPVTSWVLPVCFVSISNRVLSWRSMCSVLGFSRVYLQIKERKKTFCRSHLRELCTCIVLRTFPLRAWSPWSYKEPAARCSGNTSPPGCTNQIYLSFVCSKNNSFLIIFFPILAAAPSSAFCGVSFLQGVALSLCSQKLRSGDKKVSSVLTR